MHPAEILLHQREKAGILQAQHGACPPGQHVIQARGLIEVRLHGKIAALTCVSDKQTVHFASENLPAKTREYACDLLKEGIVHSGSAHCIGELPGIFPEKIRIQPGFAALSPAVLHQGKLRGNQRIQVCKGNHAVENVAGKVPAGITAILVPGIGQHAISPPNALHHRKRHGEKRA